MLDELLVALACLCLYITPTLQQVHHQQQQQQYPPGVPPPNPQGVPQQQVYADGHAPQGHHQTGHQGGHQGGQSFGVNPHDAE